MAIRRCSTTGSSATGAASAASTAWLPRLAGSAAQKATHNATRDAARVEQTLAALTNAASSGNGNLLELSIEATRARATVGEISDRLRTAWGVHRELITL